MANTFLKRKWTLKRVWELYRDRLPLWTHLFIGSIIVLLSPLLCHRPRIHGQFDSVARGFFDIAAQQWAHLLGPFAAAIAITVGAFILLRLQRPRKTVLWWALSCVVATTVLPLSATHALDSICSALFVGMVYVAIDVRQRWSHQKLALLCILAIVSAALRPLMILTTPCVVMFLLAESTLVPQLRRWWILLSVIGSLAIFGLLFVVAVPAHVRSMLSDSVGLGGMLGAVWTLIAAPGRSLLLHSPPLVLAIMGWRALRREFRPLGRLLSGLTLVGLACVVLFEQSPGVAAWAAEPFLAFLIVALLPAAFVSWERHRFVVLLTMGIGLTIQSLACIPIPAVQGPLVIYSPARCPLAQAAEVIMNGDKDVLWRLGSTASVSTVAIFFVALLVLVGSIIALITRVED